LLLLQSLGVTCFESMWGWWCSKI